MMNNLDVQKLGQENMDRALRMYGDWSKNWQAITTEWTDYSKRSFEQSTRTFERLLAAKSLEQAIEIQTTFVRGAYDDYLKEMSRLGSMYATFAREAYKPVETALQSAR